jgi:hypothetical protein
MICALGITEDGQKRLLGVRQGATENAVVCTALLEDLCGRGLGTSSPALLVLDGAKALHAAAKRVWGRDAPIQRCQVHRVHSTIETTPAMAAGLAGHVWSVEELLDALANTESGHHVLWNPGPLLGVEPGGLQMLEKAGNSIGLRLASEVSMCIAFAGVLPCPHIWQDCHK